MKEEGERRKEGAPPPPLVQFGPGGACHLLAGPLSSKAHGGPLTSRGGLVTLRHSGFIRNTPEHFRCPNKMVQYINLYLSTISTLLVMSVISSGTPNNLRYIKSHKLIIPIVIEH